MMKMAAKSSMLAGTLPVFRLDEQEAQLFCRGTARRSMSIEILSNVAQL